MASPPGVASPHSPPPSGWCCTSGSWAASASTMFEELAKHLRDESSEELGEGTAA